MLTSLQEKSGDERSDVGSQVPDEDYDVDEEYDNDYAGNYFDNGEGDDMDDLGDGGGGDGGGTYTLVTYLYRVLTALGRRLRLIHPVTSRVQNPRFILSSS